MVFEPSILSGVEWQDLIEQESIRVSPDLSLASAIALMNERNSGCVAIEAEGRLQGIFTARDLVRLVTAKQDLGIAIVNAIDRSLVTVSADVKFNLLEWAALMQKHSTSYLPVVNDGKLVGIVSDRSLNQALCHQDELNKMASTPPDISQSAAIELKYQVQNRTNELKIANRLLQQQLKRYLPHNCALYDRESARSQPFIKIEELSEQLDYLELPWWLGSAIALSLVVEIELLRYLNIVVPVPVIPAIAVIILSASLGRMKAGLLSTLVCSIHLAYATYVVDSSPSQMGNTLYLVISVAILSIIGLVQGLTQKKYYKLASLLQFVNSSLEREVKQRTDQLSQVNIALKREVRDRIIAEIQEKNSEAKYRAIFEQAAVGIVRAGTDKRLLRVNPKFCQMLCYTAEELQQLTFTDVTYPKDRLSDDADLDRFLSGEISTLVKEKRYLHRNGSVFWAKTTIALVNNADNQPDYFIAVVEDISDRITARIEREQLLQRIEQKKQFLEAVLQQMPAGVVIASAPNGKIVLSNSQVEPLFRHSLIPIDEIKDYTQYGCLYPNGQPRQAEDYFIVKALKGQTIAGAESQYRCGDGSIRTMFINAAPIYDSQSQIMAAVATFYDITELKQTQAIKKDAQNKALMLKEVNHRIKNNLQIISALLDLQSEQIEEPKIIELLEESQARIQTIALIHEQLYTSENCDRIKLSEYISSLALYLQKSFVPYDKQINIVYDIEPIDIDLDNAVSCGLIINELITNSLQHGFKTRVNGTIKICLRQLADSSICLVVRDNGVGMAKIDLENVQSLGLSLVNSLVTTQLGGDWSIQIDNGTTFQIIFSIS